MTVCKSTDGNQKKTMEQIEALERYFKDANPFEPSQPVFLALEEDTETHDEPSEIFSTGTMPNDTLTDREKENIRIAKAACANNQFSTLNCPKTIFESFVKSNFRLPVVDQSYAYRFLGREIILNRLFPLMRKIFGYHRHLKQGEPVIQETVLDPFVELLCRCISKDVKQPMTVQDARKFTLIDKSSSSTGAMDAFVKFVAIVLGIEYKVGTLTWSNLVQAAVATRALSKHMLKLWNDKLVDDADQRERPQGLLWNGYNLVVLQWETEEKLSWVCLEGKDADEAILTMLQYHYNACIQTGSDEDHSYDAGADVPGSGGGGGNTGHDGPDRGGAAPSPGKGKQTGRRGNAGGKENESLDAADIVRSGESIDAGERSRHNSAKCAPRVSNIAPSPGLLQLKPRSDYPVVIVSLTEATLALNEEFCSRAQQNP